MRSKTYCEVCTAQREDCRCSIDDGGIETWLLQVYENAETTVPALVSLPGHFSGAQVKMTIEYLESQGVHKVEVCQPLSIRNWRILFGQDNLETWINLFDDTPTQ